MELLGYTLVNEDKVERALNGSVVDHGKRVGGIADEFGKYDEEALLAEYDRLGGLIKKGGDNLKIGCFYDFKARRPRTEPKVVFLFRVNGQEVEVPEGTELPGRVRAARILADEDIEDADVEPKPVKKTYKKKVK